MVMALFGYHSSVAILRQNLSLDIVGGSCLPVNPSFSGSPSCLERAATHHLLQEVCAIRVGTFYVAYYISVRNNYQNVYYIWIIKC